jgi:hypothetical protein
VAAKKKPARPPPSPETFFEVACPRVMTIMRATCAELGGRYVVEVEGAGAWTLDFPAATVARGATPGADVIIHLSPAQFASLSTGKVELLKLTNSGQARFEGDRARIENVSLVLAFLERG